MPASQHRGAHRRFARQLREATLRATAPELEQIVGLQRAVEHGTITVFEAQETVRALIRAQHQRDQRDQQQRAA